MTNTAVQEAPDLPSASQHQRLRHNEQPTGLDPHQVELLVQGRHHDPHSVLGRHGGLVQGLPARPPAKCTCSSPALSPTARYLASGTRCARSTRRGLWEGNLDPSAAGYRLEAIYGAAGFAGCRLRRPLPVVADAGRPGPAPVQ